MKQIIQNLADFLLMRHPWFAKGYANAFADNGSGQVLWDNGNDYESLAFSDHKGNYFYIRHNGRLSYSPTSGIAGCMAATKKTMPCTLVALLKDGDEFSLEQCLINSLLAWRYKGFIAVPGNAIIDPLEVIESEISDKDAAEIAMANIGTHALMAITFNVTGDYFAVSPACPCDPCGC